MLDSEMIAQELSALGHRVDELEERLADVETVNQRLEDAALTTARAWRRYQATGTLSMRQCVAETHPKSRRHGELGGTSDLTGTTPRRHLFRLSSPFVACDLSFADREIDVDAHGRSHFAGLLPTLNDTAFTNDVAVA
jgi:hypothetical protein